jgi:hypothetical protein
VACTQPTQSTNKTNHAGAELRADRFYPGEKNFRDLTKTVPSFGGYFYQEGTNILIVNVADPRDADSALAKVERIFADPLKIGPRGRARIVVRLAKYSFVQLAKWRDSADVEFGPLTGVVGLDLDEALNKLVVGVTNDEGRFKVMEVMKNLTVPLDAYIIQDNLVCSTDAAMLVESR